MRDLVVNGPDMVAVFEDDARFTPRLAEILSVLETRPFAFDVVSLHRGHPRRPFIPCVPLTDDHSAGRVRYSDSGAVGYVITQPAARHFLETTPKMVLALLHFWMSGLDTFYIDPPVVRHGGAHDSHIEDHRRVAGRNET